MQDAEACRVVWDLTMHYTSFLGKYVRIDCGIVNLEEEVVIKTLQHVGGTPDFG